VAEFAAEGGEFCAVVEFGHGAIDG
jgi:hypothetical protein